MANNIEKYVPWIAAGLLGLFAWNYLMQTNGQEAVGGDAGYNRAELVNPRVAYQDIERPEYTYPSSPRRSIVQ